METDEVKNNTAIVKAEYEVSPGANGNRGLIKFDNINNLRVAMAESQAILRRKKISAQNLALLTMRINANAEDLAAEVSTAIKSLPDNEAKVIFAMCDRDLKADILIPGDNLDKEIYKKLELGGLEVHRAFSAQNAYEHIRQSPYSVHISDIEGDTGEQIVYLLKDLSKFDAEEFLIAMGIKMMYLVASEEIDSKGQLVEELLCALEAKDQVPIELVFLNYLQENHDKIYKMLVFELLNKDWAEFRQMFYDVYYRTNNEFRNKDDEEN